MKLNQENISNQNIDYYDKIAASYDAILSHGNKTDFVRKKMADKLTSHLKQGIVLDFGGGTGEDLKWLLANDYSVIFCEPSSGMRNIAIAKFNAEFPNGNITFLEESKTDFLNWNKTLPFEEKANAVIANFAVLNCILNIDLIFKNIALITAPNAELILLVLDCNLKKRIKLYFSNKPIEVKVEYENKEQLVYLHSIKSIKKASAEIFEFKSCERFKEQGFSLIHLTRK